VPYRVPVSTIDPTATVRPGLGDRMPGRARPGSPRAGRWRNWFEPSRQLRPRAVDVLLALAIAVVQIAGDPQPPRWDVKHLPPRRADHRRVGQVAVAAVAHPRGVLDDLVGVGDLRQMTTRIAFAFAWAGPPLRRGRAGFLPNPSRDGGNDEFDESAPNRAFHIGDLGAQLGDHRVTLGHHLH
jgi:hypothetical protein